MLIIIYIIWRLAPLHWNSPPVESIIQGIKFTAFKHFLISSLGECWCHSWTIQYFNGWVVLNTIITILTLCYWNRNTIFKWFTGCDCVSDIRVGLSCMTFQFLVLSSSCIYLRHESFFNKKKTEQYYFHLSDTFYLISGFQFENCFIYVWALL